MKKERPTRVFRLPPCVYPLNLFVTFGSDAKVWARKLPKDCYPDEDEPERSGAMCVYQDQNIAIFYFRHELRVDLIAHEIFHMTHRIMHYVGEKFPDGTHEAFAYLNGWITGQVYHFADRAGVKFLPAID